MKKYRLLAVLMAAIFMVASLPAIPAYAEDTIGREALACRELGILLGSDKGGLTAEYLSAIPTRLQAYIIALRLKGLYADAGSFASNNNFKDASLQAWAKNYLSYAKNTPELGWNGYADGRFGVNDKISGQAFYKVMLETLGYKQNVDFTYANTLSFAVKVGLLDSTLEVTSLKSFTTNDIAKGIYKALKANMSGTDKRLVDYLAEKGIFSQAKVEAAGLSSSIQITANMDLEYGIPMIPIEDTYGKMGCYILKTTTSNTGYEIKKDTQKVRLTAGSTSAFINNEKVTLERPVMKDKLGTYYVPAAFVVKSAKNFGYDASYISSSHIVKLQASAVIEAEEDEIIIAKGGKGTIRIEKKFSEVDVQNVTSQCTFNAATGGGIIIMGANPGDVIGNNLGSDSIVVKYMGKEIDRIVAHVVEVVPTYYPVSRYEQVFSPAFRLEKTSYTDSYGVIWNKKTGVVPVINETDRADSGTSLNIKNYSSSVAGITANLSKLLEDRAIKGKKVQFKIFAKGVSENSSIYVKLNIRTPYASKVEEKTITLGSSWKGYELLEVELPENTTELNLEIASGETQEIMVDGFTLNVE